ncbi:MAG: hypothetical protein BWZ03_00798 [bacterium ADurb.BinA186]|nr:MAG: hypothetical protein BWZ03_00798 [bacterium ADurb.BinA186]
MHVNKLEDLIVWQEAKKLLIDVYSLTKKFPADEKYNLVKHIKECARNIPGNIAEGFGRFHYQDSARFYRIARGSLNELKSDIYCSLDLSYIDKADFENISKQVEYVGKLLNGTVRSLNKFNTNH